MASAGCVRGSLWLCSAGGHGSDCRESSGAAEMMRKRGRREDWTGAARGGGAPAGPLFNRQELHGQRIRSWSPEIEDELELEEEAEPAAVKPDPPAPVAPEPVRETAPVRRVAVEQ